MPQTTISAVVWRIEMASINIVYGTAERAGDRPAHYRPWQMEQHTVAHTQKTFNNPSGALRFMHFPPRSKPLCLEEIYSWKIAPRPPQDSSSLSTLVQTCAAANLPCLQRLNPIRPCARWLCVLHSQLSKRLETSGQKLAWETHGRDSKQPPLPIHPYPLPGTERLLATTKQSSESDSSNCSQRVTCTFLKYFWRGSRSRSWQLMASSAISSQAHKQAN